jgi:hypothetical protein
VSRKTGYKWLDRYARFGPDSLANRSHRPQQCPHATSPAVIREILKLRQAWRRGTRKLHELLLDAHLLLRCPGRPRSIASWYDMAGSVGGGAPTFGPIPAGPTRQSQGPTWSGRSTSRASSGSALVATATPARCRTLTPAIPPV